MRVALFFFAFTLLFAVLIPQLIGTFLGQDDQMTQQLREGADPTVVFEETASGVSQSECPGAGFEYRTTARGEPYVRAVDGRYVAVFIDNKAELFRLEQVDNSAVPVLEQEGAEEAHKKLLALLDACINSAVSAQPSTLQLKR